MGREPGKKKSGWSRASRLGAAEAKSECDDVSIVVSELCVLERRVI